MPVPNTVYDALAAVEAAKAVVSGLNWDMPAASRDPVLNNWFSNMTNMLSAAEICLKAAKRDLDALEVELRCGS